MKIKNRASERSEGGKENKVLFDRPKLKTKGRGFTLIEMMVALAVFAIAIGAVSGLFIAALRQQRTILASQSVLDQTSYVFEYMSRSLRLAKKELACGACLPQDGLNFEITRSGTGVKFINHLQTDDCQEFFLENNQVKYRRRIGWPDENVLPLTSNSLQVLQLKFYLSGESQADDLQPKVTVFSEIKSTSASAPAQTTKIQTSISQREIDVTY